MTIQCSKTNIQMILQSLDIYLFFATNIIYIHVLLSELLNFFIDHFCPGHSVYSSLINGLALYLLKLGFLGLLILKKVRFLGVIFKDNVSTVWIMLNFDNAHSSHRLNCV